MGPNFVEDTFATDTNVLQACFSLEQFPILPNGFALPRHVTNLHVALPQGIKGNFFCSLAQ
jgi:hypothetical protein